MIDSVDTKVAHDMARVFARLPATATTHVRDEASPPKRLPNRLRLWSAILAVMVTGVVIVSLLWRSGVSTTSDPIPAVLPPVVSKPMPIAVAPSRAVPATVAPLSPAISADRGTQAPTADPVTESRERPKIRSVDPVRSRPAKAKAVAATTIPDPAADVSRCDRASDREGCFYRKVLDADRGVRRMYDRAVLAQVPVRELRKVRKTWKSTLSRWRKDPPASMDRLEGLSATLQDRIGLVSMTPGQRSGKVAR